MKLYIKIAFMLLVSLLINISCTDDFAELNTPNDLITSDVINLDFLFTRVLAESIVHSEENGMGTTGNYCGMSYSGANAPFVSGDNSGVWNRTYGDYSRNLSDIIYLASTREDSEDLVNKKAAARIMKAWVFARTTDWYGNIPYSESSLDITKAISTPKYDSQKDIYIDLFKELKEAVAEIDNSKASYGSADILYGGDMDKWVKLANSLRLRLALRIRYADETLAATEMADLTEANLITSRSDDAKLYTRSEFTDQLNDQYSSLLQTKSNLAKRKPPKTFIDILKDSNDPRLKVFADTAKASFPGTPGYESIDFFGYRGTPLLGSAPVQQKYPYGDQTTSDWSDILYTPTQELPIFNASETYFALAEAALFGLKGNTSDAQGYFEKGIRLAQERVLEMYEGAKSELPEVESLFLAQGGGESDAAYLARVDAHVESLLESHKITQTEIDDFIANAAVVTLSGSLEEQLEQIINQKMIALFPQESEGWAEWRRTGYPRILVGDDNSALAGTIPRRMPWPTSEQTINGEQYQAALEAIGGDGKNTRLTKVWWDQNTNRPQHPGTVEWMEQPWVQTN
ncbi:SusD/RagB family nutrient-binding outer membrane lipoprotein [Reichenbachiella sp. MALMAid0571]|uniref:SusD/RagB family nutrient-binding outer membrane lipoprotein n=1 Tax=Reichenbachiella sp. MALMAid0571 TaxID=3143939 RepID=UPI0032E02B68